jgi:ElaB/YqjD/DUF883 family membrane-anchored ribosome-binding protein
MADTTYKPTTGDTVRDMKDQAREFATDMTEEVSDAASRVKDTASEYGRKAKDAASEYTRKAADQFNAATDYFRGHDMKEIADDAKAWVRENPTQAIIGAAVVGFLAAALLRRR